MSPHFNFPYSKAEDFSNSFLSYTYLGVQFIKSVNWDLIIIDEAHRLRNVYKKGNKIAKSIKESTKHAPKILLTATPLQNSLLELYGLVGFIDDHIFGDLESFKEQFVWGTEGNGVNFDDLKKRLSPICQRTLRKQVFLDHFSLKGYYQQ